MSSLLENLINSMLSKETTDTLASKSGTSNEQVSNLVSSALPLLLKGMLDNSSEEKGADSLANALSAHADKSASSKDVLRKADTNDGMKILNHLFGNNTTQVEQSLAEKNNMDLGQVRNILAMMAPALMNKLGRETKSAASQNGVGMSSLLMQLASGLAGGNQSKSSGGLDLGSLLNFAMQDRDGDGKSDVLNILSGFFGGKK